MRNWMRLADTMTSLATTYSAKGGSSASGRIGVIGQGAVRGQDPAISPVAVRGTVCSEELAASGGARAGRGLVAAASAARRRRSSFTGEDGKPQAPPVTGSRARRAGRATRATSFCRSFTPADQGMVKAISEGRQDFPRLSRNANMNRALLSAVQAYDPSADANTIKARRRDAHRSLHPTCRTARAA